MKKVLLLAALTFIAAAAPVQRTQAQIIDIIEQIFKDVLEGIDLGIQKTENATLVAQDAEKQLENAMQKLHLDDITNWVQQQKDLYSEYYNELWQIKNAIAAYERVKDLVNKQIQLVSDYKRAYALVGKDKHFSADELSHIYKVYDGIFSQSVQNINQINLVINAFLTQMNDADRLRIIDEADNRIDKNYSDLKQFTQENTLISLQRAKDLSDLNTVKALYGIQ